MPETIESAPQTQQQLDLLVRAELNNVLYRQSLPTALISVLTAILLCTILWPHSPHSRLLIWLTVTLLVGVCRSLIIYGFARATPHPGEVARWERAFSWSVAVSGLTWGFGGLLVMPQDSLLHQCILYLFLMGMSGGAAMMFASPIRIVALTPVTVLLPMTLWLLLQGGLIPIGLAVAGSIYLVAMLRSSRLLARTLHNSFQLSHELMQATRRAERLARTDMLTGLNNRRAFSELGETLLNQARRRKAPLSAILLDVDHFKKINDSHGHAAGDAALQHLSRLLRGSLRQADICGRLGGEEFAVLLPDTDLSQAWNVAEKVRQQLENCPVTFNGTHFAMSASFGVASGVMPMEVLLNRADAALYLAKDRGRNRTESYASSALVP